MEETVADFLPVCVLILPGLLFVSAVVFVFTAVLFVVLLVIGRFTVHYLFPLRQDIWVFSSFRGTFSFHYLSGICSLLSSYSFPVLFLRFVSPAAFLSFYLSPPYRFVRSPFVFTTSAPFLPFLAVAFRTSSFLPLPAVLIPSFTVTVSAVCVSPATVLPYLPHMPPPPSGDRLPHFSARRILFCRFLFVLIPATACGFLCVVSYRFIPFCDMPFLPFPAFTTARTLYTISPQIFSFSAFLRFLVSLPAASG